MDYSELAVRMDCYYSELAQQMDMYYLALTGNKGTDYAQILMLWIALAAVFVGPFVSFYIAKRQIRAQLVSANRQKWIVDLRSYVAEYVTEASCVSNALVIGKYAQKNAMKMSRLQGLVLLHLNPEELESQKKLWEAIMEVSDFLTALIKQGLELMEDERAREVCDEFSVKSDSVLKLALDCLKIESELVRRGK